MKKLKIELFKFGIFAKKNNSICLVLEEEN